MKRQIFLAKMHKIAVCISGSGTNLQALIDAINKKELECEISIVVSNKPLAFGLTRAKNEGIPTYCQTLLDYKKQNKTRVEYDIDLAKKIKEFNPSLVVLAGFMHILSQEFLNEFPDSVINLHPALPGCYDGAKAIERAFEDHKSKKLEFTGVMIHKCIPEVDKGQVIVKEVCPILESDSLSDLENRMHEIEHRLIVQGVELALMLKDGEQAVNTLA